MSRSTEAVSVVVISGQRLDADDFAFHGDALLMWRDEGQCDRRPSGDRSVRGESFRARRPFDECRDLLHPCPISELTERSQLHAEMVAQSRRPHCATKLFDGLLKL